MNIIELVESCSMVSSTVINKQ